MGKKKIAAIDKNKNENKPRSSRIRTSSKKRNGLFKKAKDLSTRSNTTIAGSSTITDDLFLLDDFISTAAESHSYDSMIDEVLNNAAPSIDMDDFISTATGYPSIDSTTADDLFTVEDFFTVDELLPTATGFPSFDSMVDEFLDTRATATDASFTTISSFSSFQDILKAMSKFDLEACDDLEGLLALRSMLDQVIRERTRLI